jgi:hypothetical protein
VEKTNSEKLYDYGVDGACGKNERQMRCLQGFGGETMERDHPEDLGVDGKILLKLFFRK